MTIQVDTREHESEWKRIQRQFDRLGVEYFRSKLDVGDYMNVDNPTLIIDRKKDLLEICGNITQQHDRFRRELIRAQKNNIKLIILCEHGDGIENLSDVYFWHNPRLDKTDIRIIDGRPQRVQLFPRATDGKQLYKSLQTLMTEYGVDIRFCDKKHTGEVIRELLEYG